ncbi:MAG: InlB B-repeat-containing protein [Tannerella sp.]|jgi:uncharacterized repeat protein (TIGR02543 family)|nr:InlB B-repeat-containing protein [Tannerella sp.]
MTKKLLFLVCAVMLFAVQGWGQYKAVFDTQGGLPEPKDQNVKTGDKVNEPNAISKGGYKFVGWYYGSTEWDFNTMTINNASILLTAKWNPILTVINGTGEGDYEAGTEVTIKANDPPVQQKFKEWTGSDASNFDNVNAAQTKFIMPATPVTITATYEPITYEVIVESEGKDPSDDGYYALGVNVPINAGTPPDGKEFKNWESTPEVTFANANETITSFTMIGEKVTVKANFVIIQMYTLTVVDGTDETGKESYAKDDIVTIKATPPEGNEFTVWTGGGGGSFANKNSATTTFTMPADNVTITAEYKPIEYTVSFDSNGGSAVSLQTVNHGDKVDRPENPTLSGSYFVRWLKDGTDPWDFDTPVTEGFTLVAEWSTTPYYNVTVSSIGIGASGSNTYEPGKEVNIKAGSAPTTSQEFKNWTTTSAGVIFADASKSDTKFTMPANDVTVTANFGPKAATTYTVTVSSTGTGATGSGPYAQGAKVDISAGTPPTTPANQEFINWTTTSSGVTFANAANSSTSFTMPANAVTVTANFGIAVASVTLTPTKDTTLTVGKTVQLNATVLPSNAKLKTVQWSSSSSTIASVNASGLVTANDPGTATITVTTDDRKKTATCIIRVIAADVYSAADIAVINEIIEENGLDWPKATGNVPPPEWTGITWSSGSTGKRILSLDLSREALKDTLNVSGLTELQTLNCYNNNLTGLNVSGLDNLEALYCYSNKLEKLDVSDLTSLEILDCENNSLKTLDLSGCENLTSLWCTNNVLTALDVSDLESLEQLNCSYNNLTSLDASNLDNLVTLNVYNNKLTALNVSGSTALQSIDCENNSLTAVNVTGLTNLQKLNVDNNQLRSINLTGLTKLTSFSGAGQAFTVNLLTRTANGYSATVTLPTNITFANTNLTYSGGVLTSKNNTVKTSTFTVPTGVTGRALTGTITLNYPTGNESVNNEVYVFAGAGKLYVQSTAVETVNVYSFNGILLLNFEKPEGEASQTLDAVKGTALIVKGSSGWTSKVIVK